MNLKKMLLEFFEEYFWAVGLSVFIVGATLKWNNPNGMIIFGGAFFLIGIGLRAWNKAKI